MHSIMPEWASRSRSIASGQRFQHPSEQQHRDQHGERYPVDHERQEVVGAT